MNKVLTNTQTTMCTTFCLRPSKHFYQAPTVGADIPTLHREVRQTELGFLPADRLWRLEVWPLPAKHSPSFHPPCTQHYFNCCEISSWYKSSDFLMTLWGCRAPSLNWQMAGTLENWEVTHWGKKNLAEVLRWLPGTQQALELCYLPEPCICVLCFSIKNASLED